MEKAKSQQKEHLHHLHTHNHKDNEAKGNRGVSFKKMSKAASADTKEIPTDFMNRNEDVLNKIKNAIEFMKIDYNENSDSDCSSSSCSSSSDDD